MYVDKLSQTWWESLPDDERYPFEGTRWYDFDVETKWNIYGLYLDSLLGIKYESKQGELI